ncbi:MAG TPA: serine/threonine-protein kinase, partial [Pseudomonadota bacterium]|nr:serine/threonine-protein kinase [Pseudomonadota bacterium]
MPALQLGTTLDGRFVLEEEAGRGGMAVVFRATDLREQRRVAVKMLHPDTRTSFILDHFAREAEILATVRHPYIVSYVAHGSTADGAAYLVVEWLDGESLGARLRRGPLTIAAAVQLGARLADALRATHARGVVHRHLKPDNIFLRHGELARTALLDFAVAHRTHA